MSRMRVGWLMVPCSLAIAACTSSGDVATPTSSAPERSTTTAGNSEIVVEDEPTEDWIEPGLISDLGGYGYQCFGQLPFTDLFVLDDRPSLSVEEFAQIEVDVELGEADDWVRFPSGLRMHREPLTDVAPISVLVVPAETVQPWSCAPFWMPAADTIAFQIVAEPSAEGVAVVSIENCRDPADVEVGLRVFEGAAVLWLWSEELIDSCTVDGSVTMEIDVPPGLDRILSGQRWPFAAPLLSSWYEYREAFPDDLASPARPPIEMECSTVGGLDSNLITFTGRPSDVTLRLVSGDGEFVSGSQARGEVDVWDAEITRETWLLRERLIALGNPADVSVPVPNNALRDEAGGIADDSAATGVPRSYELTASRGDEVVTINCGSGTIPTQLPLPDCTVDVSNFVPRFSSGLEAPGAYLRDGVPFELTPMVAGAIDAEAVPGETYTYTLVISDRSDRGRPDRIANCGTVTVPEQADLITTLTIGAREFGNRPMVPFAYFTIATDGVTRDFRMEPQGQLIQIVDPPSDLAEIDPLGLHQRLLAAIEEGREVTAVVDRVSGLPTEWSIDGQRWELLCFSLDNRPPELRDGPCDPAFDLISTN